jgi:hypothetical protein
MNDLIPVVDDTRKLIALLDSIADSPVPLNIDMHDGSVVQTLKAWASTRGIVVEYGQLTVFDGGFVVDRFSMRIGLSRLVVFDMGNKRALVANEWRPTDAAVSQ